MKIDFVYDLYAFPQTSAQYVMYKNTSKQYSVYKNSLTQQILQLTLKVFWYKLYEIFNPLNNW